MNNAIILLVTMVVVFSIVIFFFYYLSIIKKRDAKTIDADWHHFQDAVKHHRIQAIEKYGTLLIWNEHITVEQVKEMSAVMKKLEKNHPELNDLKLVIYNKRKDWSKKYPRHYGGNPYM
ncbi:hypothetical protein FNJ87_14805 [Nonlabens mediterrranea]|uniref:Uncharacterized protein n=1 Tax=Nonlabens mediterrranea TaxID=1419947 RepID=A0ABS0AAH9_9FLAO|nr:hypothetical protein [Nonlabens mediterrranea]